MNKISQSLVNDYTITLTNRGKQTGITWELKNIFEQLEKQNLIKLSNTQGDSKLKSQDLFSALDELHRSTSRSTNYLSMSEGTQFTYTKEEFIKLAQAAGYEIVTPEQKENRTQNTKLQNPETVQSNEDVSINEENLQNIHSDDQVQNPVSDQTPGKILTREVNGKPSKIKITKDSVGKTIRYQVNEDGTLGEKLIPICTAGKNKYITESEMNKKIEKTFPNGLPEDVSAEFITIDAEPTLVFKRNGHVLDGKTIEQLKMQANQKIELNTNNLNETTNNSNFQLSSNNLSETDELIRSLSRFQKGNNNTNNTEELTEDDLNFFSEYSDNLIKNINFSTINPIHSDNNITAKAYNINDGMSDLAVLGDIGSTLEQLDKKYNLQNLIKKVGGKLGKVLNIVFKGLIAISKIKDGLGYTSTWYDHALDPVLGLKVKDILSAVLTIVGLVSGPIGKAVTSALDSMQDVACSSTVRRVVTNVIPSADGFFKMAQKYGNTSLADVLC